MSKRKPLHEYLPPCVSCKHPVLKVRADIDDDSYLGDRTVNEDTGDEEIQTQSNRPGPSTDREECEKDTSLRESLSSSSSVYFSAASSLCGSDDEKPGELHTENAQTEQYESTAQSNIPQPPIAYTGDEEIKSQSNRPDPKTKPVECEGGMYETTFLSSEGSLASYSWLVIDKSKDEKHDEHGSERARTSLIVCESKTEESTDHERVDTKPFDNGAQPSPISVIETELESTDADTVSDIGLFDDLSNSTTRSIAQPPTANNDDNRPDHKTATEKYGVYTRMNWFPSSLSEASSSSPPKLVIDESREASPDTDDYESARTEFFDHESVPTQNGVALSLIIICEPEAAESPKTDPESDETKQCDVECQPMESTKAHTPTASSPPLVIRESTHEKPDGQGCEIKRADPLDLSIPTEGNGAQSLVKVCKSEAAESTETDTENDETEQFDGESNRAESSVAQSPTVCTGDEEVETQLNRLDDRTDQAKCGVISACAKLLSSTDGSVASSRLVIDKSKDENTDELDIESAEMEQFHDECKPAVAQLPTAYVPEVEESREISINVVNAKDQSNSYSGTLVVNEETSPNTSKEGTSSQRKRRRRSATEPLGKRRRSKRLEELNRKRSL